MKSRHIAIATATRAAAWLIAAGVPAGTASAQPVDAYVLDVQGSWTTPGRNLPLTVGTPLPAAARLSARRPAAGDRIVVVAARGGALLLRLECGEPRACREAIVVPRIRESAVPGWTEILRRAMARLEGAPDRYVATLSRADTTVPDAVLALQGTRVDLGPVLRGLASGRHQITLRRLDCAPAAGRPGCAESSLVLDDAAGPGAAVVDSAGPGVYELRVSSPGLASVALAAGARAARLLLVPAAALDATNERYRQGVEVTERWGDAVDAGSRRGLLRALMDELAAPP